MLLLLAIACDGSKLDDTAGACDTTNEDCSRGTCSGEGAQMLPGADCLNCHSTSAAKEEEEEEEAPPFTLAGTVFTDATGLDGLDGATVEVTDAEGTVVTMTSNAVGNFYSTDAVVLPFTATVSVGDAVVEMTTHADAGGCNSCHACTGVAGGKLVGP